MSVSPTLECFSPEQIVTVNNAASMAEELVSDHYKMSASQWLRRKYDFKTLVDLTPGEIVFGPFAQIIRYEGHRVDSSLGSAAYDFYKICLQDHAILETMRQHLQIRLFPFCIYILSHELIHIIRFSKFLCNFVATAEERRVEETLVHQITHTILCGISLEGLPEVFAFYIKWRHPLDQVSSH
ncbi:MAG: hypothetical protein V2B19_12550 [Pseudomonadota bacterium]